MSRLSSIAAAALLLTATSAPAQVTLSINGVYDVASPDWSHNRTFTEFLEEARYDARYAAKAAAGLDVGLQVSLWRGLGPSLALSRADKDASGSLDVSVPHPLYFDRDRSATAELSGFDYSEQVVHAGLGWQGWRGALDFAVFGGVSLFRVRADAVESIEYDQAFPFDEITLRAPRPVERTDEPTGFHVGGRLDWRLATHFGVGAQLRYSAAKARFSLPGGDDFEIDAGGLQVAAGLRIFF